jgi:hypothetical protein
MIKEIIMKKLAIKLLLSILIASNAGSIIAIEHIDRPAPEEYLSLTMRELSLQPNKTDFEKIKRYISEIPDNRINNEDYLGGNLIDLVINKNAQSPDARYNEIIEILKAKGAEQSKTKL